MQECHGVRIEQTERLKADAPMEDKSFCSTSEESSTNRTPVIQWQHACFVCSHSFTSLIGKNLKNLSHLLLIN